MKHIIIIILLILSQIPLFGEAQSHEVLTIEPLFEYPVAPEEIESFQDKCDYLVKNFWNNFDFKKKTPVDQYALNEAFMVYSSTFRFASAKEVDQSIDKLIKNLSSNNILLLQFTKAAEECLYGPRADFWSDELYLKFLEAAIKNKKISEARKKKYITQAEILKESKIGNTAPSFWFQDKERASKQYFPMSTPTLLIFGNPDNTDWRLSRIKMDSNFSLEDALKKGKINILYIITENTDNWQNNVSNYSSYWTVGQSDDTAKHYDIRLNPTIYVVGSDGKIVNKNIPPEIAVNTILELIN